MNGHGLPLPGRWRWTSVGRPRAVEFTGDSSAEDVPLVRRRTVIGVIRSLRTSRPALVLDRYRPLRPLGRGGSGSVWLARDEQTGLEVALKIVPREGKRAARAAREMEAASRLRHERCVRAYDFGGDSGHVYIAYEYVRGRTLREVLSADDVDDATVVEIAAQMLDGLAHAHRRGIVHRDVKPSNVLVEDTAEISVRVLDFGLAQFDEADTLTAVGDVPGTLAYISPERLAGEDASERSDVWAVGVILWEALAGSHPFWGVPLPQVASTIAVGCSASLRAARRSAATPARRDRRRAHGRRRQAAAGGPARGRAAGSIRRPSRPIPPRAKACHARLESRSRARPRPRPSCSGNASSRPASRRSPPRWEDRSCPSGRRRCSRRWPRRRALVALAPAARARGGPRGAGVPLATSRRRPHVVYGVVALAWLAVSWRDHAKA